MSSPTLTELADLVILSDGRQGLRTTIQTEIHEPISSPGEGQPSTLNSQPVLDFTASDETLDRYGEIISASGWRLDNYLRNPVFQNAHQYGDVIHTLGRATVTEVRSGKLVQRIEFATDVNPIARIAYGLYKGKFLNAVSVGFVPVRWEDGSPKTNYRRKFLEQELLEVSAVSIPANPNALALAYKSGAIEKSDIRELSQLLNSLNSTSSSPHASAPVSPNGNDALLQVPNHHQTAHVPELLTLAHQIHTLLKRI
jgi:HK97 family phage prohead protease